ncbi:MAG: hypothetical protein U1D97_13325 [Desulfuromonadales bacterium]|jgi:hypothetical protein|nr:hypothetical protein [Desulfuromonadales bacterium]
MKKNTGYVLIYASLILYILGGISIFCGVALMVLMKGQSYGDWGRMDSFGYVLLFAGLSLTILGVLFMRIIRNRLPDK